MKAQVPHVGKSMLRTPLRHTSKKRARLNRQRAAALAPFLADGRACDARFEGCAGRAQDAHEIRTRARGGSIIDLANIAFLCRPCHELVTVESNWAVRHGWIVSSWASDSDEDRAWMIRSVQHCDVTCSIDHRERA